MACPLPVPLTIDHCARALALLLARKAARAMW
jgi:hypothetical protein